MFSSLRFIFIIHVFPSQQSSCDKFNGRTYVEVALTLSIFRTIRTIVSRCFNNSFGIVSAHLYQWPWSKNVMPHDFGKSTKLKTVVLTQEINCHPIFAFSHQEFPFGRNYTSAKITILSIRIYFPREHFNMRLYGNEKIFFRYMQKRINFHCALCSVRAQVRLFILRA